MSSATEIIADYIVTAKYEELPDNVIQIAKDLLLDTIGCGLGGAKTKPGEIVINTVKELGGTPESTIFGEGSKVNCMLAGFVNAQLSDLLDYEDTLVTHPSAIIIPAALAVGERVKASGKELINAMVVGYEVSTRIVQAITPSKALSKEVAVTYGSWCFGASAVACKLLELDTPTTMNAFGYAGSHTPQPTWIVKWERPLHWAKNNFGGQTAAGILGALLAEKGFMAPKKILDSKLGFPKMIGSDRCDLRMMTAQLGTTYAILNASFKPYPACRWFHPTLDAVQLLMQEHQLTSEGIKQINANALPDTVEWLVDYKPTMLVDGEFSLPYVVAMVVLGVPNTRWYAEEVLNDLKVLDMTNKVKVILSPEFDAWYDKNRGLLGEVEILATDGKSYRKRVDRPKGDPKNPLTRDELLTKFKDLAAYVNLEHDNITRIIEIIDRLENLEDITELTALLKY